MSSTDKSGKRSIPFGKFVLVKRLRKSGGLFNSFAAVHRETKEKVEIRILKNPTPERSPLTKRFIHELKLLAKVKHPSVIPVFNAGYKNGRLYFTTVLRKSVRLDKYLAAKGGKLPADLAQRFALTLVEAVEAMHKHNIIHRSLSTTAIYVDVSKDVPFIGECETAKDMRIKSLTANGFPPLAESVPTPEAFSGAELDERTDIFHLCAIFYLLISGKYPFPDDQYARYFRREKPQPVASLQSILGPNALPAHFERAILKGLSLSPDERHPTAAALSKALREATSVDEPVAQISPEVMGLLKMFEEQDQSAIKKAFAKAAELTPELYDEFLSIASKHDDTAIRFMAKKAKRGELLISSPKAGDGLSALDRATEQEEGKNLHDQATATMKEKDVLEEKAPHKERPPRKKERKEAKVAPIKKPKTPQYSLFSPEGVGIASFIGSPFAGSILIAINSARLKGWTTALLNLMAGIAGTIAIIVITSPIPKEGSFFANCLMAIMMKHIAEKYQGEEYQFHIKSGGNEQSRYLAAGVGCLSIIIVMATVFVTVFVGAIGYQIATGKQLKPRTKPATYSPQPTRRRPRRPTRRPRDSGVTSPTSRRPTKRPSKPTTVTRFGKRLVFGPTGRCEVYFDETVKQAVAQRLGDVLSQLKFFGDKNTSSVKVTRDNSRYTVYFLVKEQALMQDRTRAYFQLIGLQLAAVAFHGEGMQIRLATEPFRTRTTITIQPTKAKNFGPNIFFYSGDVSEEEADRIFTSLKSIHVFQRASSHTVLVEADTDGFTLAFCLKEGMWDNQQVVSTFTNIAKRLSTPTFVGRSVKIKLCNSLMEEKLQVP